MKLPITMNVVLVLCLLLCGFVHASQNELNEDEQTLSLLELSLSQIPSSNSSSSATPAITTPTVFRAFLANLRKRIAETQRAVALQEETEVPLCEKKLKELGDEVMRLTLTYEQTVTSIVDSERKRDKIKVELSNLVNQIDPQLRELYSILRIIIDGNALRANAKRLHQERIASATAMLKNFTSIYAQINASPYLRFKTNLSPAKKHAEMMFRRFLQTALDLPSNSSLINDSPITKDPRLTKLTDELKKMLSLFIVQLNNGIRHVNETENADALAWAQVLGTYKAQKQLLERDVGIFNVQKQQALEDLQRMNEHITMLRDSIADIPSRLKDLVPQYKTWTSLCSGKKAFYDSQRASREDQIGTLDALGVLLNDMGTSTLARALEKSTRDAIDVNNINPPSSSSTTTITNPPASTNTTVTPISK